MALCVYYFFKKNKPRRKAAHIVYFVNKRAHTHTSHPLNSKLKMHILNSKKWEKKRRKQLFSKFSRLNINTHTTNYLFMDGAMHVTKHTLTSQPDVVLSRVESRRERAIFIANGTHKNFAFDSSH
jgi:hypothetical protein